ncbi:hypothetical protein CERSUDRAFT_120148 [Gelatoporia subvermispora B]|uniref:Uncharacterized protein n=1 Tax=Ceriporiopsis subvermispora (strain B) TaxID=914234 RepID=M2QG68_CERS8|nr:hypothetical protein CERSUDRAFT_120148 [Gelatoporia subvermispora B]
MLSLDSRKTCTDPYGMRSTTSEISIGYLELPAVCDNMLTSYSTRQPLPLALPSGDIPEGDRVHADSRSLTVTSMSTQYIGLYDSPSEREMSGTTKVNPETATRKRRRPMSPPPAKAKQLEVSAHLQNFPPILPRKLAEGEVSESERLPREIMSSSTITPESLAPSLRKPRRKGIKKEADNKSTHPATATHQPKDLPSRPCVPSMPKKNHGGRSLSASERFPRDVLMPGGKGSV